jgi:5-methylcytosine-specific restriction endonuclease McrA
MPRDEAFMKRTLTIYWSMVKRFAEKRNKNGRVIRVGRALGFDLPTFREWLIGKLGGSMDGVTKCRYCQIFLTAMDVQFDHVDPIEQGGELGLSNLDACCGDCNRLKGALTPQTFAYLLLWLRWIGPGEARLLPMTEYDRRDLERRLKSGGGFFRQKAGKEKAAAQNPPPPEPNSLIASELDDF